MQSTSRRGAASEWVSIGRAAELLGVTPATLRQWTSLGTLHAYRTPGGHRRFSATEIASLAEPTADGERPHITAELMERLRQRYHGAAQSAASHERWISELDDAARSRFHGLGESLLACLSEYVTAPAPAARRAALRNARNIGEQYGALCGAAGLDTKAAIDAYVLFRRPLLDVLGRIITAHPAQSIELSRIMRDAETFMDEVLGSIAHGSAPSDPAHLSGRSA